MTSAEILTAYDTNRSVSFSPKDGRSFLILRRLRKAGMSLELDWTDELNHGEHVHWTVPLNGHNITGTRIMQEFPTRSAAGDI